MKMKLHIPKTYLPDPKKIQRYWHLLDAKDFTLGRLATKTASFLMGKNKREYTPHIDCGDYVVVVNARKIKITGNKLENKFYHQFTGYLGHLKSFKLKDKLQKDPAWVIKEAVSGMVKKNRLKNGRLKRLKIFIDISHPYKDKFK